MPNLDRLTSFSPQILGILRIVAGLLFLAHGLVKLFGFPPGAMPGVQPLMTLLGMAGLIELVAGALITTLPESKSMRRSPSRALPSSSRRNALDRRSSISWRMPGLKISPSGPTAVSVRAG